MADPMGQGTSPETAAVSDAFVAARELLRRAEEDAARLRAEVDRYVRQREQEAELLVAKARRLLAVAEERAATLATSEAPQVADLDPVARAPIADSPAPPSHEPNGLDGVLASAIAKAFDRSFPRLR